MWPNTTLLLPHSKGGIGQGRFRNKAEALLALADVRLNGDRPWDIQVHDERVFRRALAEGSLGFGDAYIDGWWDCHALDQFFHRVFRAGLNARVHGPVEVLQALCAKLLNMQNPSRAFQIGKVHYDIGNDLYERMLDARMIYSCGYWADAADLDAAQEAKLDLICRKLGIAPGMRVLDIGCGWGGAAQFAAERYGAEVVGVTVSQEQASLAKERCAELPVDIRFEDYRAVEGKFDRIFSIGMFEHVGLKNYGIFMDVARRCLKDNGLFLLHTIGHNRATTHTDAWIGRHIFPNSLVPSPAQMGEAIDGVFVLEDWHNFGPDYDKTLMAWYRNLQPCWEELAPRYGKRFRRMWEYYLLSCAGSFRARYNQLWQLVLSPKGVPGGWKTVR